MRRNLHTCDQIRRQVFASSPDEAAEEATITSRVENPLLKLYGRDSQTTATASLKEPTIQGAPASHHWPAFIPRSVSLPIFQKCGGESAIAEKVYDPPLI